MIPNWRWFCWGEHTQANSCALESGDLGIMEKLRIAREEHVDREKVRLGL
jgi:gentisate 1,2-dioxygenase